MDDDTSVPGAAEAAGVLTRTISQLSTVSSLEEVTGIVSAAVRTLMGADGATFVLREDEHCYYVDEDAIEPLWKGSRFPIDECVSGWSMLRGEAALIPDVRVDPRIPQDAYRRTFVRSLCMTPIRASAPIGALGRLLAHRAHAVAGGGPAALGARQQLSGRSGEPRAPHGRRPAQRRARRHDRSPRRARAGAAVHGPRPARPAGGRARLRRAARRRGGRGPRGGPAPGADHPPGGPADVRPDRPDARALPRHRPHGPARPRRPDGHGPLDPRRAGGGGARPRHRGRGGRGPGRARRPRADAPGPAQPAHQRAEVHPGPRAGAGAGRAGR